MPGILHRISIDAPAECVHELIATTAGIARWWTGRPLDGSTEIGGHFGVYLGDADKPAAVIQVVAGTPTRSPGASRTARLMGRHAHHVYPPLTP